MKIRTGFVSNSSSSSFTCYTVVVSPQFQLTDKMIRWAIDNTELNEYVGCEEECAALLKRSIDSLKNGMSIGGLDDEYGDDPLFETICGLLETHGGGMVVSTEESTEDNSMTPLRLQSIDKRIAELEAARRIIAPSQNGGKN